MEIKAENLKDYINVPLWRVRGKEWLVINGVRYSKDSVRVSYTDNGCETFKRSGYTGLIISV